MKMSRLRAKMVGAFVALFSLGGAAPAIAAETMVTDISDHLISISSDFTGTLDVFRM